MQINTNQMQLLKYYIKVCCTNCLSLTAISVLVCSLFTSSSWIRGSIRFIANNSSWVRSLWALAGKMLMLSLPATLCALCCSLWVWYMGRKSLKVSPGLALWEYLFLILPLTDDSMICHTMIITNLTLKGHIQIQIDAVF